MPPDDPEGREDREHDEQVATGRRERRRLEVRPGMTGLAQTRGRGEIPHEEKLELDVQYVEKQSVRLDLWILWRTAWRLFSRKDAYQKW